VGSKSTQDFILGSPAVQVIGLGQQRACGAEGNLLAPARAHEVATGLETSDGLGLSYDGRENSAKAHSDCQPVRCVALEWSGQIIAMVDDPKEGPCQ